MKGSLKMIVAGVTMAALILMFFVPSLNVTPSKRVGGCTTAFCEDLVVAYHSPSCLVFGQGTTIVTSGSSYFNGTQSQQTSYYLSCVD
ncbi:MAG: hypothetical protein M1587_09920 [Thaumarchaeota archaeon]|nr:hypothetical protein [Nitrososphaerota archaeon]